MDQLAQEKATTEPDYLLPTYLIVGCMYFLATIGLDAYMVNDAPAKSLWLAIGLVLSVTQFGYLVKLAKSKSLIDACAAIFALFLQLLIIVLYLKEIPNPFASAAVVILLIWMVKITADRCANSEIQQSTDQTGTALKRYPLVYPQCQPSRTPPEYRFPATAAGLKFDDIHGMDEVKTRIRKAALDIINPQVDTNGRVKLRNGILFSGEPGNGKTVFAEAIAGEFDLPIVTLTYGDVASKWVNDTTENVMQAFRDARAQAPCVFFIDEVDSLIGDRSGPSGGGDEAKKTTNTILTELVNLRGTGVIIVAATNYLDKLDGAAIREGRFDFKIEISPPDEIARQGILLDALNRNIQGVDYDWESVTTLSKRWEGYSVKRIQAVAEELSDMHSEKPIALITGAELFAAMRRVQGRKGKIPPNTKMLDELILPEQLRNQLKTIATRMRDFERVEKLGGTVPSGLLFFGLPGTGKTETARALAKETSWAFLCTSGNDLINNPSLIDKILAEAKDIRPCIVFIDEADDVLSDRKMSHVSSVTNKLLTAMDGAGGKVPDIVYIAATNHPENMDSAALRGGRFTEKVHFALPDQEGLTKFVTGWVENSPANFAQLMTIGAIVEALGDDVSIANAGAIMQEAVNQMIGRTNGHEEYVVEVCDIVGARAVIFGSD